MNGPTPSAKKRGTALIVVLALVFVMSVLALSLLSLSETEQQNSRRYVNKVRARMLAQSGIERARAARLTKRTSMYFGEDWNANGTSNTVPGAGPESTVRPGNTRLEPRVPPKYALHPSFDQITSGSTGPDLLRVRVNGTLTPRGYTGTLPASRPGGTDYYSVRVIDQNTKLNVNSLNERVFRTIDVLYRELGGSGLPGSRRLQPARPPVRLNRRTMTVKGGFRTIDALRSVLTERQFDLLEPYLTTHHHTWLDSSVIKPDPQNAPPGGDGTPGRPLRTTGPTTFQERTPWIGNWTLSDDHGPFHYDFDFALQPRAPINVNRAPVPVLTAVLTGLRARIFEMTEISDKPSLNPLYQTRTVPDPDDHPDGLTRPLARRIARTIDRYRSGNRSITHRGNTRTGPFETWPEFESFVEQLLVDGSLNLSNDLGHLLKAHFNPNTRPGKLNPNRNAGWTWISDGRDHAGSTGNRCWIDKTDLRTHTREFTFRSGGWFSVSSYGAVVGPHQRVRAEAQLSAIIQSFRVARHTTEADFVTNSNWDNDGGTWRMAYYPEATHSVLRNNVKTGDRTAGRLSGKMSVAPRHHTAGRRPVSLYFDYFFDGPDPGDNPKEEETRGIPPDKAQVPDASQRSPGSHHYQLDPSEPGGTGPNNQIGVRRPYGLFSREYIGVGDDGGSNHGVLSGQWSPDEFSWYPWTDPANYADLVADGILMTGDRMRTTRFRTTEQQIPSDRWQTGHVEFWWKPRLGAQNRTSATFVPLQWWFLTQPHARIRVPLFDYTRLSVESGGANVPPSGPSNARPYERYPFYGRSRGEGSISPPSDGSGAWIAPGPRKLFLYPGVKTRIIERNVPSDLAADVDRYDDLGGTAGYRFHLRARNTDRDTTRWTFRISFESVLNDPSTPGSTTFENAPRDDLRDLTAVSTDGGRTPLTAGTTEAILEGRNGQTNLRSGAWYHVTLEWEPKTFRLWYPYDPIRNGQTGDGSIDLQRRTVRLIEAQLSVNGQQADRQVIRANNINRDTNTFMPASLVRGLHRQIRENRKGPSRTRTTATHWFRGRNRTYLGNFGQLGGNVGRANDARFYRHRYAEGTLDEFYFSSLLHGGPYHPDRYFRSSDDPLYNGFIHRQSQHQHQIMGRSFDYWDTDGNGTPDKYNHYAADDQRVLGGKQAPLRVLSISHTQYRPRDPAGGIDYTADGQRHPDDNLPAEERPRFRVDVRTNNRDWVTIQPPSGDRPWLGAPVRPGSTINRPLKIAPSRCFQYRLRPVDRQPDPNVTPFFEDITIRYRRAGAPEIHQMSYDSK